MNARGKVARYEVSHERNRRGIHLGDKTRIVIDIPQDLGDEAAELQSGIVTVSLEAEQSELPA